jgi:phospholipid transport system substrate-binding protein
MIARLRCIPAALLMLAVGVMPAMAADLSTEPVTVLDDGLLQAMHAGSNGQAFESRCATLQPAIQRAFNLPAVLRRVIGLRWEAMSSDQQHALLASFTRFTVATYAANFNQFGGQHFDLTGMRPSGSDQIVGTTLVDANGSKVKLDYVVEAVNGYWQIIDVLLDGSISRSAVLRSDFRSLLTNGGPEALIHHLDQKTADLAKGRS